MKKGIIESIRFHISCLPYILRLPKVPSHTEQDIDGLKRDIIAKVSTGNISIQQKRFYTSSDIVELRRKALT